MKRFLAKHSPLVLLAGLSVLLAILSPDFRDMANIQVVLRRTCVVSLVAIGQTLVIITGGIDLSVGSVAALGGVVAGLAMTSLHLPMVVAVLAGTLAGGVAGGICGLLWTRGRIPAFIATLGMMMAARGVTYLLSGGKPVYGLPHSFRYLGGVMGWWIPVLITVCAMIVFSLLLNRTRFGRAIYASGGNVRSARLSGINVDRVRIGAFLLCGLLTGFAGCMLASRTGIAEPTAAKGMELESIAACVIGGASLMGGEGGIPGAVAGGLIMKVLVNFCNLNDIDVYWQDVLIGVLIVVMVMYDSWRKYRAGLLQE